MVPDSALSARKIFATQYEHHVLPAPSFKPVERQIREGAFDNGAVVANFNSEDSALIEVRSTFRDQASDQVETVVASCQRHAGFVQIFSGEGAITT